MKRKTDDLVYSEWNGLNKKEALLYRRGDEIFFYSDNIRYDVGNDFTAPEDAAPESGKVFGKAVPVETNIPDGGRVPGYITVEISEEDGGCFVAAWIPADGKKSKYAVIVLAVGRLIGELNDESSK